MKNILLVSHYTETQGVMHKLALYLIRHNYLLSYLLNPLEPKSSLYSILKINETEIKYKIFWQFQYVFEGIFSLIFYRLKINKRSKFDLAICFDPLSFFHTFFFRRLLNIDKIVYFNVDFSTRRFKNVIFNHIYLSFNRFAYKKCNYFFSITKTFLEKIDPADEYISKVSMLKHTIDTSRILKKRSNKVNHSIIYAGNLSHTVDFANLIKALEVLKSENINFIFDIYGSGPQEKSIRNLIKKSPICKNVALRGVVTNSTLINRILPKYSIGVCPYINKNNNYEADHAFTGTDLTTKLVEYIGSGLPIITTRLYGAFDMIEKNKIGFLAYTSKEWYLAIKKLLLNEKMNKAYSRNALSFAKKYDEEEVLTPIFSKILGV